MMYKRCRLGRSLRVIAAVFLLFGTTGVSGPVHAQMDPAGMGTPTDAASNADAAINAVVMTPDEAPKPGNITVNFKNVDILTVLNYLSEVSGVDIIPTPGVEGTITMRLRDKPWEVALDIVTRNYGYAYSREEDIIRIMPKSMLQTEDTITEVIALNHLVRNVELVRGGGEEDSGGGDADEVSVVTADETIDQIMNAIKSILDSARNEKATYVASVNAVIVTAIPAKVNEIKAMLAKVDKKPPQLLLDAKVLEIRLTKDERLGIDWQTIISAAGARRPITFPFTSAGNFWFLPSEQGMFYPNSTPVSWREYNPSEFPVAFPNGSTAATEGINSTSAATADSIFSYGTLDFSTFQLTLSLLDERGDTEILSCPRLTTLNNQKATIKVVDKIMLQKTQETTQTAGIVTVEFETEDEAREVGIMLTILPHVNDEGDITVNLRPEVSSNSGFDLQTVGVGQTATLSLTFSTREANTQVRVRDGETIFIGGLIRDNVIKTDNKFPVLGDLFAGIPVLGNVFRYEADQSTKTEIVFFVTVHLIKHSSDSVYKSATRQVFNRYGKDDRFYQGQELGAAPPNMIMYEQLDETNRVDKVDVPLNLSEMQAKRKKAYEAFLELRRSNAGG